MAERGRIQVDIVAGAVEVEEQGIVGGQGPRGLGGDGIELLGDAGQEAALPFAAFSQDERVSWPVWRPSMA